MLDTACLDDDTFCADALLSQPAMTSCPSKSLSSKAVSSQEARRSRAISKTGSKCKKTVALDMMKHSVIWVVKLLDFVTEKEETQRERKIFA